MKTRSVVVANAGSGKTYLLANRLIGWMIAQRRATGCASPERILAVTFTRKAAGEILQRVLRHLALGALDAGKRAEYGHATQFPDATADEYAAILRECVDAMHRLSISTIDGFFMQLAGAFGHEIGLPEGWGIAEEDEAAEQFDDAVGGVIAADPARAAELARRIASGAPQADVQAGIHDVLEKPLGIVARVSMAADPRAPWQALLRDGVRLIEGAKRASRDEVDGAVRVLSGAQAPLTKAGKPVKNWVNALPAAARAAAAGDWFEVAGSTMLTGVHATGAYSGAAASPEVAQAAQVLVPHALACIEDILRARIEATADLAQLVDAALWQRRGEDGRFGFQDITLLVARAHALAGPGAAAMRERLDRAIQDVALDEFQDTSPAQWAAMEPLVGEILATRDRRFLVVGDPKQSIYAWRGGTPALLSQVEELPGLDPEEPLSVSRRSSQVIMDFVNALFGGLAATIAGTPALGAAVPEGPRALAAAGLPVPAGADRAPLLRALDGWTFVPHRAHDSHLPGVVRAYRAAQGGAEGIAAAVAGIVADRAALRADATIAVLVRSNAEIAACATAIRARGLAVSDEGRSQLLDSPAVTGIVALLRLADQPDDRIAHWLATRNPCAVAFGLRPMEEFGGGAALRAEADRISAQVRADLHVMGLAAWVDCAVASLRGACSERDVERLRQLSAMAHDAGPGEVARPGAFVRAVESRGVRAAIGERIRVMTVHASKGLEFDEVVVGSMDGTMGSVDGGQDSWAVLAPNPAKPPVAVAPVPSQDLLEHSPLLRAFKREAEVAQARDDVSVLYVAVTRAKDALHLVCAPPPKADSLRATPTRLLRLSINGFEDAFQHPPAEGGAFWTMGDPALGGKAIGAAGADAPVAPPPARDVGPIDWLARPGMRAARPPSAHGGPAGAAPSLAAEYEGAADGSRGSLAHAWMERIEWLAPGGSVDPSIESEVLRAVAVEIGRPVDRSMADEVRGMVVAACRGAVGDALRVDRCASWGCDTLLVHSELPYVAEIDGRIQRGRIDRLVLGYRGGRVVRAEVLDHKTGATGVAGDALEARIAPYRAQMAGYRRVVASMFGIEPSAVSTVLLMLDRGEVIDVTEP